MYLREDGTRLDSIELEPVATTAPAIDLDGDGYTAGQGDCDDTDAGINPDATEICDDGIDQDCDGLDEICPKDIDDDGFTEDDDCNDTDAAIHPGAVEICGDGIDQDCDGSDLTCANLNTDSDGDGFSDSEEIAGGFDPNDPNSNPGFNPAWNSASTLIRSV